jgi:CRP/FNR family transcriptional regulator, cyclic AMP receptor protein
MTLEGTVDSELLKTIPLFSSLSDKALDTVSVFATETDVSPGTRLVHEGDYSYDLMVIETGTADVIRGDEVVGSLGPGDVFGEMGMLSGAKRSADVIATSSMRLITLTRWDLKRISGEVGDQLRELVEQRQARDEGSAHPPR